MKDKHIIKILDNKAFAELNQNDLTKIQTHTAACLQCLRAFEAARVSSVLIRAQAEVDAPAPSPFFEARVINALRERANLRKPIAAFRRWWQASATLVSLMLITIAGLIALTALAPSSSSQGEISSFNLYSTDSVILNQNMTRDLTTEQVFQTIYDAKEDTDNK